MEGNRGRDVGEWREGGGREVEMEENKRERWIWSER